MPEVANITDIEKVPVTLVTVDAAGNTAGSPTAPVTWASSDETIVGVVPGPDTLTADIVATGPLGAATVTITDAAGLSDTVDVTVAASAPAAITAVVGAPEPK